MMFRFSLTLVIATFLFVAPVSATEEPDAETFRLFDLFSEVFERVRSDYVEEVDDKELIEAAIRGMLSSLDPHSGYMGPEDFRENQIQTRGEYGGVGMEVTMQDGVLRVIAPMDGTPASRAGMQSGDYITHADGETIVGMTLSEGVSLLRGPVDTEVVITVVREGEDAPFEVTLLRQIITISAVRHRVERGTIGYLRLNTFNNAKLSRDLRRAMRDIQKELGDDLRGYVLDMRNNPGGLLDQAIEVTDIFLDRGEIVSNRGRHPRDNERWNASRGDMADGLPIVILVNAGTASASEIVTGALQDHRRATVLGVTTFGKGLVQSVIPLGPEQALRLTTARYYTPSGRSIQAVGIVPDIVIEQPRTGDEDRRRAPRRESDLRGHLENENGNADAAEEQEEALSRPVLVMDESDEPVDYQLKYALDLLEGVIRVSQQAAAN